MSRTVSIVVLILAIVFAASAQERPADAAAIRAHIESIFQAFIDGDQDKIFATHSEDWRGFLEGSHAPIKGIDDYMRANGIEWPRPANAPKLTPYLPKDTTYKVFDFDVHFYGPELGVASFFGEFQRKDGDTTITLRRFRIMDVYAKRKGGWIQVASHTVIDPDWRAAQMSRPTAITPPMRQRILAAREAVWKAWFANDRATLEKLIPEETIAINDGGEGWSDRAAVLDGAKRFAESGGKLVRLEFPKTEIQVYGNTVIIYTTYLYETEVNGNRKTSNGRATEMFVRRGDDLVNVGWHMDSGK
ncbi:MAG TPA: nuclear transport factor 2 family protein [Pyrinomonadaceae bacterium]|jgi:ketosteroid isomerase-like protein|nr:nuclear transport factor 2 family protein [Pyrinomonadaceae bacterium]